jgi:hypothetical protein
MARCRDGNISTESELVSVQADATKPRVHEVPGRPDVRASLKVDTVSAVVRKDPG